ncbi:MAG: hypothetical protein DMF17_12915, partial [Verrucomicrobia bacterium]
MLFVIGSAGRLNAVAAASSSVGEDCGRSETRRMTGYFMKRFFLLFLTISAGVGSVFANLGDGGDGIDDSYGNLVERHLRDDGTVTTLYHK